MFRLIFTAIVLLTFTNAYSQSIKGLITDKENSSAIAYATVILKNSNGDVLKVATTNNDGKYVIAYKKGNYSIEVSFIGYKTHKSSIVINEDIKLNIIMEIEVAFLDEVVLIQELTTVQQLIDKKVINVGKDLLSSGGDATTVLSQLPEIRTDQNGAISLRGNQNVNVLINGKPSPLSTSELLQQISADDIYKIEIITSPSAKYQANGLTGIINIITKKKVRKDLLINTSTSVNTIGGYSGRGSLTYGKSKTNYKFGASYKKNIFKNKSNENRMGILPFFQLGENKFEGDIYGLNGGIDWFPNDSNEFSFGLDYTDNGHTIINESEIIQNTIRTKQNTYSEHSHITLNIIGNYRHNFKNKKSFLELDLQLSNNTNILDGNFKPNLGVLDNKTDNDVFIASTAIDYSGSINKKLKIEAGALWNHQNLDNYRTFFGSNGLVSNQIERFKNTQSTFATYTLLKYDLEKLKVQAGIRAELFNRKAELMTNNRTVKNDYTNLFPSLHLSYNISEKHTLVFGYNRRTSRPTLSQVNPIAFQIDEFSIHQGNPELESEFSNNFDASYTFIRKKFSITPSLSYRLTANAITNNSFVNNEGVKVLTPTNNGKTDSYVIGLTTNIKPLTWYNFNFSFNWNYQDFRENQIGFIRNFSKVYGLNLKNEFTVSPKTNVVLSWNYRGAETSYFYDQTSTQPIEIGIRHKIFKKQGTINLRVEDIFNNQKYEGINSGAGFSQSFYYKPISRLVYVSFSYKIIGGKVKQRNKKERQYNEGIID
ncbi:TonB-dependent receptor [uncultured Flavobacterium sp.]|uniref:TonB-dependent receptor domain-containing protein n=1 Tax=uncultured Flavobacterium sp. TaxID=165435 RepID=UPI0030CA236B